MRTGLRDSKLCDTQQGTCPVFTFALTRRGYWVLGVRFWIKNSRTRTNSRKEILQQLYKKVAGNITHVALGGLFTGAKSAGGEASLN